MSQIYTNTDIIKDVAQKREAQSDDAVLNFALSLEDLEVGFDVDGDVKTREVSPVRLRLRINLSEQHIH